MKQTLPNGAAPFDALPLGPDVHLALFVHQVEDMQAGLYMLVRNPDHLSALRAQLNPEFTWEHIGEDLPLYLLQAGDFRAQAECITPQAIAGDSAFSLAMLARFEPLLRVAPWRYPGLYWEAGLIGQVLYLEAEAKGLRQGTGIGCFLDDAMHELLGVKDHGWQDIYHFTVGAPVEDLRIQTKPAYHHLTAALQKQEK